MKLSLTVSYSRLRSTGGMKMATIIGIFFSKIRLSITMGIFSLLASEVPS